MTASNSNNTQISTFVSKLSPAQCNDLLGIARDQALGNENDDGGTFKAKGMKAIASHIDGLDGDNLMDFGDVLRAQWSEAQKPMLAKLSVGDDITFYVGHEKKDEERETVSGVIVRVRKNRVLVWATATKPFADDVLGEAEYLVYPTSIAA